MNEMLLTTNSATRAHALHDQFSSRQEVALYHSIMSEQFRIGLIVYVKRYSSGAGFLLLSVASVKTAPLVSPSRTRRW
jgi:hypothetical protein